MVLNEKRPTVSMLVDPQLQQRIFTPESLAKLSTVAHVIPNARPHLTDADVLELLDGAVACLTGWGTPPLTEDLLDRRPTLRLVAHAAGSVHHLIPPSIFQRGLRVTHSAVALSEGVAEFTILQILQCLRRLDQLEQRLRAGEPWAILSQTQGHLLSSQVVGLVGASLIGRGVVARLRPFGCRILLSDPYLSPADAVVLGVELTDLDTLFARSDLVSLHAPLLPSTRGMITARHLAQLRDGGTLLNTARAGIVDNQALLAELRSGRISAALDVFPDEPLPDNDPLRTLPNVLLSPHIAAMTTETLLKQGEMMIDDIVRFLNGEALLYEIQPDKLSTTA